jgi:3-oxoacyl-[acyl-carrier protein] reductase
MSAVRLTKLVLPDMKKNRWGRVINITSLSVKQPVDNLLLSNTFRSGLTAFAKTISNAYGEYGITVNNVAPGHILTDRLKSLIKLKAEKAGKSYEEIFEMLSKDMPVKRFGKPEEFASAVVFLASEQASYITGVTLQVDGGIIKSTY